MNVSRTPKLPYDLKTLTSLARNKNLTEALRTIAAVALIAAIFLVVLYSDTPY
ncbi:MAG: hypothetical protein H7X83_01555 [Verrucomicrobia bacterium]|nr:hypothetical protein [Deltaproteobacteria bacterium]